MNDPIEMLRRANGARLAEEIQATNEARGSARRWRIVAVIMTAAAVGGWAWVVGGF